MENQVKRSYSDITEAERTLLLSKKRKYVTLSFDDGVIQDGPLMDIFDRYGIMSTFNINTGVLGLPGKIELGDRTVPYDKVTREEIANGYYRNHEIAVHTLHHPSLPKVSLEEVERQIAEDEKNIIAITGVAPTGMAYPGGGYDHNDEIIDVILKCSGVRYARTTVSTYGFGLPKRFMEWHPSCRLIEARRDEVTEKFAASKAEEEDLILYVWGHAYEMDVHNIWESTEAYCKRLAEMEDVIFVTNRVIYKLFADKVKS